MSIDERIQFLLQSQESLGANIEAMHEAATKQNQQLSAQIETLRAAVEIDAENIRALARIAAAHEDRITRIEDGPQT